jgi:Na+/proline symporter
MGWVTLAMAKIVGTATGLDKWTAVLICVAVTLFYSLLSGLWGGITDFFQFFIAINWSGYSRGFCYQLCWRI